jgi:hypothetical protein
MCGRLLPGLGLGGMLVGLGYRLKAIERRISTTTNTAVSVTSIDSPPARTGRSTRRTGAICLAAIRPVCQQIGD